MSRFEILDENNNVTSYELVSYEISRKKDRVIVKIISVDFNTTYELRPDRVVETVDDIEKFLGELLKKVTTTRDVLRISECFTRMYVTIGYENDDEYVYKRFTASKI